MRQKIVAGNWKMQGSTATNQHLLDSLIQGLPSNTDVSVIVFPPAVYLEQVSATLAHSSIAWGAQNVSANEPGAYTGEIAASMLHDFNCRYVLVGHSERRSLYHEDDALLAMKFAQAIKHDLVPIFCLGETLEQRQQGQTEAVVKAQLDAVLQLDGGVSRLANAILAYEPVWAIGTGQTATPEQAQAVHAYLRGLVSEQDASIANSLSILYGGSVKAANASDLFAMPDIDGGLIGGASLDAQQFIEIMQCFK